MNGKERFTVAKKKQILFKFLHQLPYQSITTVVIQRSRLISSDFLFSVSFLPTPHNPDEVEKIKKQAADAANAYVELKVTF